MAVEIRGCESNAQVQIATLSGRLDLDTTDADSPVVMQSLADSTAGVVIDLGGVEFISSSGLRMLLAARKEATATDKQIAIVRARPPVYKIFKVSSLDGIFRFFESEEAAIGAVWQ